MALLLNRVTTPLQWCLMRQGSRRFALLGKATLSGLEPFGGADPSRAWALTSELGCLRLERLRGDEEITGENCFLPNLFSNDYGVSGAEDAPHLTRAVFGLLPAELQRLLATLRRGCHPTLGWTHEELRCSLSACLIPAGWPHVVVSNSPLFGNVVSLESFLRLVISSLPQGRLVLNAPGLHPVFQEMVKLLLMPRPGLPYHRDLLELAPVGLTAAK
jgi:hypothetical protein